MLDMNRQAVIDEFGLTSEIVEKLDTLVSELLRWQTVKNLVGPATLEQVWSRHIADSLQLHALAPDAKRWLDLGSGAGFPGLVLAILGSSAGFNVTLVESNARKCAFLRHVTRLTEAAATIHVDRLERIIPEMGGKVDILTARALAPLFQLLEWGKPLLETGAIGLFPKGRDLTLELQEAGKFWELDYKIYPSRIDPESSILWVTSVRRMS
jgi:16S rRNA (guanine(527)-N(7))-methyltransferase GidB